jgi:hypothetical protein
MKDGMAGAIKTITIMVLVSIHPFAFRRLLLIAAVLFGLSAVCFGDCLFMTRQYSARPIHGRQFQGSAVVDRSRADTFSIGTLTRSAASPLPTASALIRLEVPFRLKFAVTAEPFGADFTVADTPPMN